MFGSGYFWSLPHSHERELVETSAVWNSTRNHLFYFIAACREGRLPSGPALPLAARLGFPNRTHRARCLTPLRSLSLASTHTQPVLGAKHSCVFVWLYTIKHTHVVYDCWYVVNNCYGMLMSAFPCLPAYFVSYLHLKAASLGTIAPGKNGLHSL